jgi:2-dehydropantoate 2-reductase
MRIVVVGPGAMGCLLAAALSKVNADTWLLDKNKQRARQIDTQGIIVEGVSGNWKAKLRATASAEEINSADLIIIAVKSYDTHAASVSIKRLINGKTSVITVQNGLGNVQTIGEIVGEDKVIAAVTSQGATLLEAGHIRHAGKGETVIGRIDGRLTSSLRQIREVFKKAKFETRISRDIKGILWSKLIINVGINALTAITRLNNGRLVEFEGTRQILRDAVLEAIKVAKRKRIKLIYDDPLAKVEAVSSATAANVSSMLQDVLKKKRTEIDFINGVIVRQAKSLSIPSPVNSLLLDLVKTIESSYKLQVF